MLPELKIKLQQSKKLTLKVRVTTKSGKHEITDTMSDGTIKIKLKAAPEKGKANEELIELLSDYFEVPEQNVKILTGESSRMKLVEIRA